MNDERKETGFVLIQNGLVYVEADAAEKWIRRFDSDLAAKWQQNVDHMVRTGVQNASKK